MHSRVRKTLLIIDDDTFFCKSLVTFFKKSDFDTVATHSGQDGLGWCQENRADVVLLDQKLPDIDGLSLCDTILATNEQAKIILITAYPSFDHAVQALRNGAYDYLSKPVELEELQLAVLKAFRTNDLERFEQLHKFNSSKESKKNAVIGIDGGLKRVKLLMELASSSRAPVLITGETGTGKNVIAKAIHYSSDDKSMAFIDANCAALPESLIESELFGHEKGAFTGAVAQQKGMFELADGGTLFLDEIGELPLHLQSKLLGILDDGILRRIGGQTVRKVDVRVIAATNVEMTRAITDKKFREDLYYRLGVLIIHLPPLRERREDIEELCHHFMRTIIPEALPILPDEELHKLLDYPWPGNIRELKNTIERAIILRQGNAIYPSHLMGNPSKGEFESLKYNKSANDIVLPIQTLEQLEKEHIKAALVAFDNNHTHAAKALGVARSTLIRKLSIYNL